MDIDLGLLRTIEREKEIPFDELVRIIEQAILTAYAKHSSDTGELPEGARAHSTARPATSRSSCRCIDEEGAVHRRRGVDSRRLRPHRRLRREAGHQPAPARHRGRRRARRVPRQGGRHRRRHRPAGTQPADGARRPRLRRGDPAARGAGRGRGVHARRPAARVRHLRREGQQGTADHRVAHASRASSASCSRSRCPRSMRGSSRSSRSHARPAIARRSP